MNNNKVFV